MAEEENKPVPLEESGLPARRRRKKRNPLRLNKMGVDPVSIEIKKAGEYDKISKKAVERLMKTNPADIQRAIDGLAKMHTRDRVVFDLVTEKEIPIYIAKSIVDTAISMISIMSEGFAESLVSAMMVQYGLMIEEVDDAIKTLKPNDHYNRQQYVRLKTQIIQAMQSILPQTVNINQKTQVEHNMGIDEIRQALIKTYGAPTSVDKEVIDVEPEE